jgi:hypothetical protein
MWMAKMPRDEIGTFDVKGKRAVLFGDGEGKIAFTAMAEYVSLPSPSSPLTIIQVTKKRKIVSASSS